MDVLHRYVDRLRPGGILLDLQVVPPLPVVEAGGRPVCAIEGQSLLDDAEAAARAVDGLVATGRLREDGRHDHSVLLHYRDGAELVDDFAGRKRSVPAASVAELRQLAEPCVVREWCRTRLLRVP